MTLTIGRGRGYVPAELNRGPETTIGVIPIDSIFSPVRRVAYEVEAARVGQRTDYDKLVLDVTTDSCSTRATRSRRRPRSSSASSPSSPTSTRSRASARQRPRRRQSARDARHGELPDRGVELGVRSYNCLKRVGIETIGDLTSKSESELVAIPNFGRKSIEEVRAFGAHGLTLKGEELV